MLVGGRGSQMKAMKAIYACVDCWLVVCVFHVCVYGGGEVDVLHIWTNDTDTQVYGRTIHKHLIGGARPGGDAAEGAGAGRRRRGGADGEEIERSDG